MDEHQKVFILAADEGSAGKICDKLNRTRPVKAEYFLDIKEFLSATLADDPDFLVVSMEYHHPRIENFPTVFHAATGKPVIASTESAQPEFSRLVNRSKADLKISGKMNAHNLWVKILSYTKEQNNKALLAMKQSTGGSKKPADFLKSDTKDPLTKDSVGHTHIRAKKVEEILKDLNRGREIYGDAAHQEKSGDGNSGFFHDKGRSTKTKTSHQNLNSIEDSENRNQTSGNENNFSFGSQEQNKSKMASADGRKAQGTLGRDNGEAGKKKTQDKLEDASAPKNRPEAGPSELDRRLGNPRSTKASSPLADNVDSPRAGKPTSENAPGLSLKKDKKTTRDQSLKTNNSNEKLKTFEDACRWGLQETLNGTPLQESPDFESTNLMVIAVDQKDFKGYLILANSFDAVEEPSVLLELKSNIQLELEKQGFASDLADIVNFQVDSVPFSQWSTMKCDFAIHGEMSSGKQYCLSFLPRKRVVPPYKMAEDRSRILVNLQHIPPGTNVNFNGYIFLERNNRYVCVLKKGGSICLEQIKRFMKNEKYQNFHISVEDRKAFFQFYIHNRVNWEIVTYVKELKDLKKNKAA